MPIDWAEDVWRGPMVESMVVLDDDRKAKVTYRSEKTGKTFNVIIRQKPNPIGFHAKLPGAISKAGKSRKK